MQILHAEVEEIMRLVDIEEEKIKSISGGNLGTEMTDTKRQHLDNIKDAKYKMKWSQYWFKGKMRVFEKERAIKNEIQLKKNFIDKIIVNIKRGKFKLVNRPK